MKTVEIMVPCPWFPEAVKLLNENPGLDVGIHLTLTSEWDNVKWRPLTCCPSLVDSSGYFFPKVWPDKNYPGKSILENKWKIEEIEKEIRAQIELAKRKIPHVTHVSAHMAWTMASHELEALAKKIAKEYQLNYETEGLDIQGTGYAGPTNSSEEKIRSFINMLDKFKPGNSYLFVDHPGLNNDEMKAVYHIGYENVSVDRQGVTDLFTNPSVKEALKKKGILVYSYKEMFEKKKK